MLIKCQLYKDDELHKVMLFTIVWIEVILPKHDKSWRVLEYYLKKRYSINVAWRAFNASLFLKMDKHKLEEEGILWRSQARICNDSFFASSTNRGSLEEDRLIMSIYIKVLAIFNITYALTEKKKHCSSSLTI